MGTDVRAFRRRGTGHLQGLRGDHGEGRLHATGRKSGTFASSGAREAGVVPHRAEPELHQGRHDKLRRVSNSEKTNLVRKFIVRFRSRQIEPSFHSLQVAPNDNRTIGK